MRTFAVRMGDYVEFRSSRLPPKRLVSKLVRKGSELVEHYDYLQGTYVLRPEETNVTLRLVWYLGGRVLGVMKSRKYSALSGAVKFGHKTMVELPKTFDFARYLSR